MHNNAMNIHWQRLMQNNSMEIHEHSLAAVRRVPVLHRVRGVRRLVPRALRGNKKSRCGAHRGVPLPQVWAGGRMEPTLLPEYIQ